MAAAGDGESKALALPSGEHLWLSQADQQQGEVGLLGGRDLLGRCQQLNFGQQAVGQAGSPPAVAAGQKRPPGTGRPSCEQTDWRGAPAVAPAVIEQGLGLGLIRCGSHQQPCCCRAGANGPPPRRRQRGEPVISRSDSWGDAPPGPQAWRRWQTGQSPSQSNTTGGRAALRRSRSGRRSPGADDAAHRRPPIGTSQRQRSCAASARAPRSPRPFSVAACRPDR